MTTDDGTRSGGGLLQGCGLTAAVVGAIVVVVLIIGYVQLQSSFRGPQAVPVAAAWQRAAVRLPSDKPAMQGRLSITSGGSLAAGTRLAITAGVPDTDRPASDPDAGVEPADLLRVPVVRLTVTLGPGATLACLAPCELDLSGSIPSCKDARCHSDVGVLVERLDPDAATPPDTVIVDVAGGVTAALRQRLPDATVVTLAVDEPAPSGGS